MTAEYKEDVDGLTIGECLEHPIWPTMNHAFSAVSRLYEDKAILPDALLAARAALAEKLPSRPKPTKVTADDWELADRLARTYARDKSWSETVAPLIAAYRVKHSGAAQ